MTTDNLITSQRIADTLTAKNIAFGQKRMFGGECFMVDDKMLMGTFRAGMMARIDPSEEAELMTRPGVSIMTLGGKAMAGYLYIEPEGYESDQDMVFWVEKCLQFNPKAKGSKQRAKGKRQKAVKINELKHDL